jgi:predicted DNA-binding transcriptional regulator
MDEIKTKIDNVLEFIQKKETTTKKEVSKEFKMNSDELDKYIQILHKSGMIKVRYNWLNTYISAEVDPIKMADEFKDTLNSECTNSSLGSNDAEIADRHLKIMTLKSMLMK